MNRPNVNERTVWNDEKPYAINKKYVYELEKYCDSLEKALEKACFTISGFEYVNAEDVKGWLMKDD